LPCSLSGEITVDVLGPIEFGEPLMAYALHEWRGRLRPKLPPAAAQLSAAEERFFVRGLVTSPLPVAGPILAIARDTTGPITLFDGMHRMAAWCAHVAAGRQYLVEITLVVTEHPSQVFELPAP
jgi:hypothetical protein